MMFYARKFSRHDKSKDWQIALAQKNFKTPLFPLLPGREMRSAKIFPRFYDAL